MQSLIVPNLNTLVNENKFILPPNIEENEKYTQIYKDMITKTVNTIKNLNHLDEYTLSYLNLSGKTIDIMTTMNARELLWYFKLRTCDRAQWEIRELAEKIITLTGSSSRINHIAARHNDPRRKMPNLSRARKELRWEPATSLNEGLKRTVEYIERELTTIEFSRRTWVEMNY